MWWKLLGLCVHVHNCCKQCPTKLSKRPTKIEFVQTCVHAKPNSYFQHCVVTTTITALAKTQRPLMSIRGTNQNNGIHPLQGTLI